MIRCLRHPLPFVASFVAGSLCPEILRAQVAPVTPTILSMVPDAPNPALPLPDGLRPQVEFWKTIYSRLGKDEVVFHDRERVDVLYGTHTVPEALTPAAEVLNQSYLESIRERYRAVLLHLAEGVDPDTLAGEARRIHDVWGAGTTPERFARAAEQIRWQRGLRERFIEGLAFSGRYQPHIEQVFREEGVPLELTFLPFVESMYDMRAYSSAGAAGVWQFMRGTGRLFLRIDGTVDERMDPIRAARAAARLLRKNYDLLGTWPLAITAYNHGLYGMKNAVRVTGTRDIERIVKTYQGRAFGFASRNFYAEFLAALDVRRNFTALLGDLRLDPALEFDEVPVPLVVKFSAIAQALAVPVEALWEINPAFTPAARTQDRPIPAGHVLRLPRGAGARWGEAIARLRARQEIAGVRWEREERRVRGGGSSGRRGTAAWYVVRRGDTLGEIAERHGLGLSSLRRLNGLGRRSVIHPGQRLRIAK